MPSPNVSVVASLALLTRTPFKCNTRWQWCSKPAIHHFLVILVQLFKEITIIIYFIYFLSLKNLKRLCGFAETPHALCCRSRLLIHILWIFLTPCTISQSLVPECMASVWSFFTSKMPKAAVWIEDIWPHKTSPTQDILTSLVLSTSTNSNEQKTTLKNFKTSWISQGSIVSMNVCSVQVPSKLFLKELSLHSLWALGRSPVSDPIFQVQVVVNLGYKLSYLSNVNR